MEGFVLTDPPLDSALAQVLPDAPAWQKSEVPDGGDPSYILRSTRSLPPRSLDVRLRDGGDVEVCFAITGVRGSPFEQLFTVGDLPSPEAAKVVADFVGRILSEELVLVMSRGALKGGREFVKPEDLARRPPSSIRWAASWSGTYDRGLFGA